jgi:DNA invertase Pin-like site-specific DNA recombinase
MNRPALKQLLDDIAARQVDTVVVYKVDRLTRSLTDFAKIIEVFDKQGVSFRFGDPAVQYHQLHGKVDLERAAVVCPVRARGDR